jgi:hypothetical protein
MGLIIQKQRECRNYYTKFFVQFKQVDRSVQVQTCSSFYEVRIRSFLFQIVPSVQPVVQCALRVAVNRASL